MKLPSKTALIMLLVALCIPLSSQAQSVTIPGNYSVVQKDSSPASAILFQYSHEGGKSYCCGITYSANVRIDSITGPEGTVNRSRTSPIHTNNEFGRFCHISTRDGSLGYTASGITTTGTPTEIEMQCVETSLYGSFNTSVNNFNFLEVTNTANSTINGFITATSFDGQTVIDARAFSVEANKRLDVDIHTPAGANNFGTIKVTHDGPFGSIMATTSYYKGTAEDFTLTGTVPARPRDRVR